MSITAQQARECKGSSSNASIIVDTLPMQSHTTPSSSFNIPLYTLHSLMLIVNPVLRYPCLARAQSSTSQSRCNAALKAPPRCTTRSDSLTTPLNPSSITSSIKLTSQIHPKSPRCSVIHLPNLPLHPAKARVKSGFASRSLGGHQPPT